VIYTSGVCAFLWHYVKQYPVSFLLRTLTMLVWSVNEALFPYFIKEIIDVLAVAPAHASAWALAGGTVYQIIGLWLFMDICMRFEGFLGVRLTAKFCRQIRQEAFSHLTGHTPQFFNNNFAGNVANKVNDLPRGAEFLVEQIMHSFSPILFMLLLSVILMAKVSFFFAGVMVTWFCLHSFIVLINLRKVTQGSSDLADATSQVAGKVVDALSNILSMRLFGRRSYEQTYFGKIQDMEAARRTTARSRIAWLNCYLGALTFVLLVVTFVLLMKGWEEGWVSVGEVSLISMLTFTLIGLIWHLSFELSSFFKEMGLIRAALSFLRVPYSIVEAPNAKTLHAPHGEIRFENVTFGYQENTSPLFQDLSVRLVAGEKVGLVGFSGSGKTTFVNMIVRAFDPQKGRITIDGQDIRDVSTASLAGAIAFIPQDPSLFHRTLLENIRYGRLEASDADVFAAARLAHADTFIEALPQKYHTSVGERGLKLSGGQRQRIAIARAALKNAPILILDEATSALDSVTERLIQDSFHEIMGGRTTLVIAHRLSTLQDMDRILVFDHGRIVEDGTCEALLANENGAFAKLWRMQSEGFLPDKEEG